MNDLNDTTASTGLSADALRAGYEQLRAQALGTVGGSYRGFGLALLLRAGLAAWLHACRESVSVSQRPSQPTTVSQMPSHPDLHAELTMILTAMALADRRATV